MSDFSNKRAFLKELEQLLPDDAYFFGFKLAYNSNESLRVIPGKAPNGLVIYSVSRHPLDETNPGGQARYELEGQL